MEELKHYLEVNNFGPLKNVKIDLDNKNVIVLIGPQASGKSTIAKLLGILMDSKALKESYYQTNNQPTFVRDYFVSRSIDLGIDKYYGKSASVKFKSAATEEFTLKGGSFSLRHHMGGDIVTDIDLVVLRRFFADINFVLDNVLDSSGIDLIRKFIENLLFSLDFRWVLIEENEPVKGIVKYYDNFIEVLIDKIKFNLLNPATIDLPSLKVDLNQLYEYFLESIKGIENNVIYTPSERNLLSIFSASSFSIMRRARETSLPNHILDFGTLYQKERNNHRIFKSPTTGHTIIYRDNIDYLLVNEDLKIPLQNTASGIQSLIPIEVVVAANSITTIYDSNIFIIEEPELNLYPTTQKKLMEFLIEKCTKNGNKLIITTHSPYVLTAISNSIKAGEVAKQEGLQDEVSKIIPEQYWLNYENVGAYYVADGKAEDIMDAEYRTIKSVAIDDVSESLSAEFDSLLELQYRDK